MKLLKKIFNKKPDISKLAKNKSVDKLMKIADENPDYHVRCEAISALAKMGDPIVIPVIKKQATSITNPTCVGAIKALGHFINNDEAADALIDLYRPNSSLLRINKPGELGSSNIYGHQFDRDHIIMYLVIAMVKIKSPKTMRALVKGLKERYEIHMPTWQVLICDRENAKPYLVEALNDPDPNYVKEIKVVLTTDKSEICNNQHQIWRSMTEYWDYY